MTQEGIEIEPLDWSQAESTDASAMPQLQPPAAKPPRASKGGRNSRNTRNKPEGALDAARVALAASDIDQAADLYSQLIARGKMLDDIIDDLDAAALAFPNARRLHELLGQAHTRKGNIPAALEAYRRAMTGE